MVVATPRTANTPGELEHHFDQAFVDNRLPGLLRFRTKRTRRIRQPARIVIAISASILSFTSAKPDEKLKGRIHFVAKGEMSLILGDEVLGYADSYSGDKFVDGLTQPYKLKSGDIVFFKMRSSAVHRDFIVAIESKDGTRTIPIRSTDLHCLGVDVAPENFSPDDLDAMESPAPLDSTDPELEEMWRKHSLPGSALDGADWIKLRSKGQWDTFALEITPKLLRRSAK